MTSGHESFASHNSPCGHTAGRDRELLCRGFLLHWIFTICVYECGAEGKVRKRIDGFVQKNEIRRKPASVIKRTTWTIVPKVHMFNQMYKTHPEPASHPNHQE
jgi:hypothetical protein